MTSICSRMNQLVPNMFGQYISVTTDERCCIWQKVVTNQDSSLIMMQLNQIRGYAKQHSSIYKYLRACYSGCWKWPPAPHCCLKALSRNCQYCAETEMAAAWLGHCHSYSCECGTLHKLCHKL